jgi:hypothetical protein
VFQLLCTLPNCRVECQSVPNKTALLRQPLTLLRCASKFCLTTLSDYVVCLIAFVSFVVGVIQKIQGWGSDIIRNQQEDAGAELPMPDIYLVSLSCQCLDTG